MAKIPDQVNDPGGLEDLSPPKSQYGTPIPVLYGSGRMQGVYIEAYPLREEQIRTTTTGPRSFPIFGSRSKVTTVTYNYYATFTVALCVPTEQVQVRRIWLNNTLIVDLAVARSSQAVEGDDERHWYPGFSGAHVEVYDERGRQGRLGREARYRGMITMAFLDIPVADFGNSFPKVEVELEPYIKDLAVFPRVLGSLAIGTGEGTTGVWVSGTTLYASYGGSGEIKAFNTETGEEITNAGIAADPAGQTDSGALWGNATHLYSLSHLQDKIFVYNRSTRAREMGMDIDLAAIGLGEPICMTSDGQTIWIYDRGDVRTGIYQIAAIDFTGARQPERDFTREQIPWAPSGLWTDGQFMWVAGTGSVQTAADGTPLGTGHLYCVNLLTKERDVDQELDLTGSGNATPTGIWYGGDLMWVGDSSGTTFPYRDIGAQGNRRHVLVADIIRSVCRTVGVPEEAIDTAGVPAHLRVRGYIVGENNSSGVEAIRPLLRAFDISATSGNGILEFRARSPNNTDTTSSQIVADDLIPFDNEGTAYQEERKPESELARKITLTAIESEVYPYETYTVAAQRIQNPTSTVNSDRVENLRWPLMMGADLIKDLAHDMLRREWLTRDTIRVRLDRSWLHMDVGDPISIVLPDELGRSGYGGITGRVREVQIGSDLTIELEILSEPIQFPAFSGIAETIPHFGPAGQPESPVRPSTPRPENEPTGPVIPQGLAPTVASLWDAPLIADTDDVVLPLQQWSGYFAAGAGNAAGGWRGSTLTLNPASGGTIGFSSERMVWGETVGILPPPDSYWRTDRRGTLLVRIADPVGLDPALESISQEDFLGRTPPIAPARGEYNQQNFGILIAPPDSGNPAFVEYIHFRDVDPRDDGVYALSHLLRGVRGTETGYPVPLGSMFILLGRSDGRGGLDASVNVFDFGVTDALRNLRGSNSYRASSEGLPANLDDILTFDLVGRTLQPYPPANLRAEFPVGGGVRIKWDRRARVGGSGFTDGSANVPVGNPFDPSQVAARYTGYMDFTDIGGSATRFNINAVEETGSVDLHFGTANPQVGTEVEISVRQFYDRTGTGGAPNIRINNDLVTISGPSTVLRFTR